MGEKTEPATPKRRRDERKKGHVMVSQDTISVVTLFASIFMLRMWFRRIASTLGDFMVHCLDLISSFESGEITVTLFPESVSVIAATAGPMLLITIFASIVATMTQTRMLFTMEPLKPKFSKLNPINGLKNLFSLRGLVRLAMNLVKIIVLLVVIYTSLRDSITETPKYLYAEIYGSITHVCQTIFSMLVKVAVAFLVIAAVDYLYQHFTFEKDMKMSKQEIKEEYKQMEGDPQIKNKIKSTQRQMAMARMMQNVPKSDVVIRNPTHVAVALRYHSNEDMAPVVMAMGVDYIAQRIVEIAEEHDIIIIENVPLARALYAEAELNRPIPPDLYEAVAEVMVYLYKLGRISA